MSLNMRRPRFAVYVLAAGGVLGCGGGGSVPIDELGPRLEEALCGYLVRCGGAPDQATCRAAVDNRHYAGFQRLIEAVRRRTTKYNSFLADECIEAYAADPCEIDTRIPEVCHRMFDGTLSNADSCEVSEECMNNGGCLRGCPANMCCAAECRGAGPPIPIGQSCSSLASPCSDDAFCNSAGICAPKPPLGSICEGQGLLCDASYTCEPASPNSSTRTCQASSAEGATCDPEWLLPCKRVDNFCDPATLTCVKRRLPGQPCVGSFECASWAQCMNNVCVPKGTVGEACNDGTGPTCLLNLECNAGTCVLPVATICET
jgi:hypothetical protein